jgi:hypothetical protein
LHGGHEFVIINTTIIQTLCTCLTSVRVGG